MNQKQRQRLERILRSLPDDVSATYPAHIYEPVRYEILWQLVLKEQYKLLSFMDEKQFEQLGDSMIEWLAGDGYELAPLDNWWNFLDSLMMGLKFKPIVPFLTSANIDWSLRDLNSQALSLYWPVGTLSEFERREFDYRFVSENIINDPVQFERNLVISDEKSNDTLLDRNRFPIVALQNIDGSYRLLDGNRRLMRAWLYDKSSVSAWVGKVTAEPVVYDHWVNTADLRQLLYQLHIYPGDKNVWNSVRSQLEIVLPSSSIARHNYRARCLGRNENASQIAQDLLYP